MERQDRESDERSGLKYLALGVLLFLLPWMVMGATVLLEGVGLSIAGSGEWVLYTYLLLSLAALFGGVACALAGIVMLVSARDRSR